MTTGIYKLSFANCDKVYVGQSINMEYRYTNHLWNLNKGIASKKLQEAFNLLGIPNMEILYICSKEQLNEEERKYINLYNSFINGLNSSIGGESGPSNTGNDNGMSLYKEEDYYNVLYFLGCPEYSFEEIKELTGVSIRVIQHISDMSGHLWLEDYYPIEYQKLKEINLIGRNTSKYLIKRKNMVIVAPDGNFHEVINIKEFSDTYKLDRHKISAVLNEHRKSHKGWHLKTFIPKQQNYYPKVVSPEGEIFQVIYGEASDFARKHGLDQSAFRKLFTGEAKSHKGWKKVNEQDSRIPK